VKKPDHVFISAATRQFWRTGRSIRGYRLFDFLHGYFYARFPYLYISVGTGQHPLSRAYLFLSRLITTIFGKKEPENQGQTGVAFANTYHGKVIPLETARQLVSIRENITVQYPEQVIPYDRARDLILNNPDHILVIDCPCRAARPNPCQPMDVCLIIGEPFTAMVRQHHPTRSRWLTRDEAIRILEEEDQRGHVHHAFFKDAMLGRFYAICNCCECCCGAIRSFKNHVPMLASSGFVASVDRDACIGCGTCVDYCQFDALSNQDGYAQVDSALCMGCGVCVSKCPSGALSLVQDPSRGLPMQIPPLYAPPI